MFCTNPPGFFCAVCILLSAETAPAPPLFPEKGRKKPRGSENCPGANEYARLFVHPVIADVHGVGPLGPGDVGGAQGRRQVEHPVHEE